jgi:hypothetical protein
VHLPDGARATVTVEREAQVEEEVSPEELEQRRALIAQMKAFGKRLTGRQMNLGALILEGRGELEDRA